MPLARSLGLGPNRLRASGTRTQAEVAATGRRPIATTPRGPAVVGRAKVRRPCCSKCPRGRFGICRHHHDGVRANFLGIVSGIFSSFFKAGGAAVSKRWKSLVFRYPWNGSHLGSPTDREMRTIVARIRPNRKHGVRTPSQARRFSQENDVCPSESTCHSHWR
jgi:hypothetical protein